MAFTRRLAKYDDCDECEKVARASFGGPNSGYLTDAWDYFYNQKGGMVCVCEEENIIGIGRFTVLPDGSGWIEALRVDFAHHRMGAGKMIYDGYTELAEQYGCQSMAMFTGLTNVASESLAEMYGLKKTVHHKEYHLENLEGGCAHGFKPVNWRRAVELCLPKKEEYGDYFTFNRTFHHINEKNIKAYANLGYVYEDAESGSFIVCGNRFQHMKALHVAMMGGDMDKCIDFAINLCKAQNQGYLSCVFTVDNKTLEEKLIERGFVKSGELITKEAILTK